MKYLNYILIVLGAVIAIYANSSVSQNQYILMAGIVLLMIGIYRISRTIPGREDQEEDDNDDNNEENHEF